jgi:hypothetical protein
MISIHPFVWLSASGQKRGFIVLLALTLAVMVSLNALGRPLNTEAAPSGIVSFELAGRLSVAQRMVESWGQRGQVYAGLNLGLDYLFMVAYSSCISLGCVLVARRLSRRINFLSSGGVLLAWTQFVAALLDAVENYALIRILLGSQQELWPAVARWCAMPKFLIVGAGLLYVAIGVVLTIGIKEHTE